MPKIGEKERKIRALKAGKNVRPPLKWRKKMMRRIRREYPHYSVERRSAIVGGIWHKRLSTKTKIMIIEKYQ